VPATSAQPYGTVVLYIIVTAAYAVTSLANSPRHLLDLTRVGQEVLVGVTSAPPQRG